MSFSSSSSSGRGDLFSSFNAWRWVYKEVEERARELPCHYYAMVVSCVKDPVKKDKTELSSSHCHAAALTSVVFNYEDISTEMDPTKTR